MTENLKEHFKMVKVIYVLLLLGCLFPVMILAGGIMAYITLQEADDITKGHYQFQFRTVWIGVIGYLISGSTLLIAGIGAVFLLIVFTWWVVRCVKGLMVANAYQPMQDPDRLGF